MKETEIYSILKEVDKLVNEMTESEAGKLVTKIQNDYAEVNLLRPSTIDMIFDLINERDNLKKELEKVTKQKIKLEEENILKLHRNRGKLLK